MHSANSTSRAGFLRPVETKQSLAYHGTTITDRGEKLSLTDMWKAAGSPANQDPAQWMRTASGEAFIEAVSVNMGNSHNDLVQTVRGGKAPGTWAHWQVAFAYAKYLSPDFHMWCNQVVREKMEGKAFERNHGLTDGDRVAIGGIVKRTTAAVVRDHLDELLPALVEGLVAARLAGIGLVRRGQTAKQIWDDAHLPPRLRGATVMDAAEQQVLQYCNISLVPHGKEATFKVAALMAIAAMYDSRAGEGEVILPASSRNLINPYRWLRV